MWTKISSIEYFFFIIIFICQFAFRVQIDTIEDTTTSNDNKIFVTDHVLIYSNSNVKGSLFSTLPNNVAQPRSRLLFINWDRYQRNTLPSFSNSPTNNSSLLINCSSPAIWIDRFIVDRSTNFDQYRDLMLFYSFTVLEQCINILPLRMAESFLRNVEFKGRIYLLSFSDGRHEPNYYSEMLKIFFKLKISSTVMLGDRISFFLPEVLDQNLQNVLGSIKSHPAADQPVKPVSDRPTFTLFATDSADAQLWDTMPCELMSRTPATIIDPSPGIISGITSTGNNGAPSTLIPPNESLLNSFSRTSVLFVSVSFIILMVISLAWLVFYYVQRFRYNHAKDRLERRLCNAVKKVLTKVPAKTLKFGDKELEADCPVCIEPYRNGDVVRILPCRHIFHKTCVDPWLLQHRTCPMCKSDILKAYGYHIGHRMPDLVNGDHLSTGGHSTDGGILSRHHHWTNNYHDGHHHHHRRGGGANGIHPGGMSSDAGSLGSAGTLNGYGTGAATDSDLHDPFFPSSAPSPSLLQPVLHQANTQAFSIIPLTVHSIAPPPPTIMVRPATCPISSSPLHPAILIYNKNPIPDVVDKNNCCNHSATSSDDDGPSSTCGGINEAASKPLFRISAKLTPQEDGNTSSSLLAVSGGNSAGRFRSAQTGRRRWLQQKNTRMTDAAPISTGLTAYSVDESSLSRAIFEATKNVVGRLNTPRSSSSHDLCFVRRGGGPETPRCSNNGRSFAAVVDPPSPPYFRTSSSPRRGSTCVLTSATGGSPSLESL